jgi:branched-chain amino acid aminotransferase
MNIMVVINGVLITPALTSTILAGVTRDSFLTLAREEGFKVEERAISVVELIEAAENGTLQGMFGAGTAATIAQVEKLTWEDKTFTLPTVSERVISNTIGSKLLRIKKGLEPDTHGWIMTI